MFQLATYFGIHAVSRLGRPTFIYVKRVISQWQLLGAFTKLRKATISFVLCLSVRPSVRLFFCPHGTARLPLGGFSWNLIFMYFSKICWENSSFIKIKKNKGYFTRGPIYIFRSYLAQFFLEWKIFQTRVIEKVETHIFCLITFFLNRAVYEIMWKNIIERGRPQTAMWHMRIACWIPKATNTPTQVV